MSLSLIVLLVVASLFEVGGDALIRTGLHNPKGPDFLDLTAGIFVLALYGFFVNMNELDFGKLMGLYIVVFFIVSQVIAYSMFHTTPNPGFIIGGILILAGGAVIQFWS